MPHQSALETRPTGATTSWTAPPGKRSLSQPSGKTTVSFKSKVVSWNPKSLLLLVLRMEEKRASIKNTREEKRKLLRLQCQQIVTGKRGEFQ